MTDNNKVLTRQSTAADVGKVEWLCAMINDVYNEGEGDLFIGGLTRTGVTELSRFLTAGNIILATSRENGQDECLLGSIHVERYNDSTAKFGMLAVCRERQSGGIGRKLITAAESWARDVGCSTMKLELLFPKEFDHKHKTKLHTWYSKIGYVRGEDEPFEKGHLLVYPCYFYPYYKPL